MHRCGNMQDRNFVCKNRELNLKASVKSVNNFIGLRVKKVMSNMSSYES